MAAIMPEVLISEDVSGSAIDELAASFRVVREPGLWRDAEQLAAERQLGVCEGSDWCWWFGDDNPAESVRSFDALYRRHLTNLYRILEEEVPGTLAEPIAQGGGAAELGGVMKRSA